MSAKYLAKFRVAMSLAGVKVQASADLIGKSFVIVLQDLGVPANLLSPSRSSTSDCLTIL